MNEQPAELLGAAWPIMLEHHTFFMDTRRECVDAWDEVGIPQFMQPWFEECQCEECGSSLLRPHTEDVDEGLSVGSDDNRFRYVCVGCGYSDRIGPLMEKQLYAAYDYDARDGGEPGVETCEECHHDTFVINEQHCLWCEAELDYPVCKICEEALGQDDQFNGGLCGYHHHMMEKMRDE